MNDSLILTVHDADATACLFSVFVGKIKMRRKTADLSNPVYENIFDKKLSSVILKNMNVITKS
ncbi:MAG: hypothetical protein ACJAYR_001476 [Sneathiella sp.]|jgi:hypothetical protein